MTSATISQIHHVLDPPEPELAGAVVGVVGTVVVVVASVVVEVAAGTVTTAGCVVVGLGSVVVTGAAVVGGLVGGLVGGGATVVGASVVGASVVRTGRVGATGALGRSGRDVVVTCAIASVVVDRATVSVGPVAIGCSGRGAEGFELDPHAANIAVASNVVATRAARSGKGTMGSFSAVIGNRLRLGHLPTLREIHRDTQQQRAAGHEERRPVDVPGVAGIAGVVDEQYREDE